MGLSTSKKTTTNDPWAPAQPYILNGLSQTQSTFDANQPRLQDMSQIAQDAYERIAPMALGTSGFVQGAQDTAQSIAGGKYVGSNPGASAFSSLMQPSNDPSMGTLKTLANGSTNPALGALSGMTGGGANSAIPGLTDMSANGGGINAQQVRNTNAPNLGNMFAGQTAAGGYLGANPSADYYNKEISGDFLGAGNPYLNGAVKSTSDNVTRAANARFAAAGMGEGLSTPYVDVLSKNLANSENDLRFKAYDADRSRQLQAAGQSDSAFAAERQRMGDANSLLSTNYNSAADRGLAASTSNASNALDASKTNANLRMSALGQLSDANNQQFRNGLDASTALGSVFNQDRASQLGAATALGQQFTAGQNTQLDAAKGADSAYQQQMAQMMQALGMVPGLADAQYAGVAPALSMLNAAATAPYIGVSAFNGGVNGLSNGYGTSTTTQKGSVMDYLMQMQENAAKAAAMGG